ncbi:hypothetical protein HMPREF0682_2673 [Propionibacterium acidifaciens F0233]|uniref:Uncharacterized protein n=1 Tax=Propionibacterium acidifaciens F0233 TaxID=553198 RepID=U2PUF8_9ACTN|nr:hypothetical protein HMPREF0682_2673 [Propionibacterium acidifaciens F0233]
MIRPVEPHDERVRAPARGPAHRPRRVRAIPKKVRVPRVVVRSGLV